MKNLSFSELISSSLKKYLWYFIVLSGSQFIFKTGIFIGQNILNNNPYHNINPLYLFSSLALIFIEFIIWIVIKLNLNHKTDKTSLFIQALFKTILFITIYSLFQTILYFMNNIINYTQYHYRDFATIRSSLLTTCLNIITVIFLIYLISSYSKLLAVKTLIIIRNIAVIFVALNMVNHLFVLNDLFKYMNTTNKFEFYNQIDNIFSIIFSIVNSIIWVLFIIKFVSIYNYYCHTSLEIDNGKESEYLVTYNQVIIKTLKKYYLIVIGTGALVIQFLLVSYYLADFLIDYHSIKYITDIIFIRTLLQLLHLPIFFFLFAEVFLFIWLIKIVVFKPNQFIITPLLILLTIYFYTFFYLISLLAYIFIETKNYENSFTPSLILLLIIMMFLLVVILNHRKPIKYKHVLWISIIFIFIMTLNLITSSNLLSEFTSNSAMLNKNIFPRSINKISTVMAFIISLSSMIFWIGFVFRYCIDYKHFYNDSGVTL